MTISSERARVIHLTSSGVTDYVFPFKIFKAGEVRVVVVSAGAAASVVLTVGADYSVAGLGVDSGGKVSLTSAGKVKAGTGKRLVILRAMAFVQEVDYRPHDLFPAETHERALDILTMQDQELRETLSRAILAPEDVTEPISYAELQGIVDKAMDWAKVAEEQVALALKSAREAAEAAAAAAKVRDDFYKLNIAVDDAPYGHMASGSYNAATNMLTLRVPEGKQGERGIEGARGPEGSQGDVGPAGTQGVAGPLGPAGPQGSTGPQGPKGDRGERGKDGAQGPPGSAPRLDLIDCGGAALSQLGHIDAGNAFGSGGF